MLHQVVLIGTFKRGRRPFSPEQKPSAEVYLVRETKRPADRLSRKYLRKSMMAMKSGTTASIHSRTVSQALNWSQVEPWWHLARFSRRQEPGFHSWGAVKSDCGRATFTERVHRKTLSERSNHATMFLCIRQNLPGVMSESCSEQIFANRRSTFGPGRDFRGDAAGRTSHTSPQWCYKYVCGSSFNSLSSWRRRQRLLQLSS